MDDDKPHEDTKKTVEAWAQDKGMLPQFIEQPPVPAGRMPDGTPRVAIRPPLSNEAYVKFAAAKAYAGWPIGKEVTEKEFDEAVDRAMNSRIG